MDKYKMKDMNTIRRDKRLRFQGAMKPPMHSGFITFSTGRMGHFVFSVADGTEHASVEMINGTLPKWEEMCELKDAFWDDEEEVIQIHPRKSEYVNIVNALHLWRPADGDWNRLMNGGRAKCVH